MKEEFSTKLPIENQTETTESAEDGHPGFINSAEQLEKLNIDNEPWLKHNSDNIQIRTSCKEEEDFVILPDTAW